jgi:hypothetical protein
MITRAALSVLNRLADGEILYQHKGQVFFHHRRGGVVSAMLVNTMGASDLLQAGPDHGPLRTLEMTDEGRGLQANPPSFPPVVLRPTASASFLHRVIGDADLNGLACILWPGALSAGGYPRTTLDGVTIMLHKFIYERQYGPLPEGVRLKNECGFRNCINPSHWRDALGLRDNPTDPRAIYARIMRAPTIDEALAIIAGHRPIDPDVVITIENLYCTHQPKNFDELWALLDDPDFPVCTRGQAQEVFTRLQSGKD